MSCANVDTALKKTSKKTSSLSTEVGNNRNMLLCTTYALNNSDTKKMQVGLRTTYDMGPFEPTIRIMGNTSSGILLDLNTWEKFKNVIPSANSYLCGENKNTPTPIIINNISINFTSAYSARAVILSQRGKMLDESGPAKKTSEESTHLKQPPLKKRKLYTENIIMQKTSFDGLQTVTKCIDTRYEQLQAVTALVLKNISYDKNQNFRKNLRQFLMSLRGEDSLFCMHANGKIDMRGTYCALVSAKLTNVYTPDIFRGTEEWIAKCQTWEGGFGGCPGMEAHGGYAYCGLAAFVLLGKTYMCRLLALLKWIVNKQMRLEGGFQGHINKLVDGCYSFWQGGAFLLIHAILSKEKEEYNSNYWLFNQALQEYILVCCQHPLGGLLDKPGKNRDLYHTCYALSGLSVA
ncbi:protein farnesyltransferase subunit beta-like [Harpegnathos saltator]|uniref:protein farnesyltransferase subunit beta-like n=1 Tax=Harpegnathos saltator TaxID=610380 RepID=UPI000DBEF191|nr:protein farnesyltransferase subunit beta-like [Harpegnathos saltator]